MVELTKRRNSLNSAVGTPEYDAKLQQFRASVLPVIDDYDDNDTE
jgi:hypothetical protein